MPTNRVNPLWEILVVDDDEGVRDLIVSYFSALEMPVTGAQDGRAAIATLQRSNGRFGLVITDLSLPGADGFAVLQAARQANAACYVVIVTGYASLDSAIHAVRVGAYDYLAKPFSMGQLDVVLKRITDRVQLEEANRSLTSNSVSRSIARMTDDSQRHTAGPFDGASVEMRMLRVETALARIEARLETALGSPGCRQ